MRSSRRFFLVGVAAALAVEAIVAALIVGSGVIDVAATRKVPLVDRVLAYASTRSIAHHAGHGSNPRAGDAAAAKRGLERYREDCVACHGAPGAEPAEFAAGLHPAPPDLASSRVQSFTDGMLYRAITGGIGSTGMPAFGPSHSPEEIWDIVTFVRRLPALTVSEKEALGRRGMGEGAPEETPARVQEEIAGAAPARSGQHIQQVTMSELKFAPATLSVRVGDAVEWKNDDFVAHTATADDHSFDTGRIDAGQTKRLTMKRKGRFPYFCRYHLGMKATLIVE